MKHAFISALLLCCIAVFGQDFAVTTKGDTLRGKIKIMVTDIDKGIQITGADKRKTKLTILQVKSFTQNGERFETIRQSNSYSFMKPLREGYLSLYAFQLDKQFTYDGRFLVKRDGQSLEVPNLMFKKGIAKFLAECPAVVKDVEDGKLGRNDIDIILDNFNSCIAKKSIQPTAKPAEPAITTQLWDDLLKQIEASQLPAKSDATDMATEVKLKISRGERVPKFLIDGLTQVLAEDEALATALASALQTIKP